MVQMIQNHIALRLIQAHNLLCHSSVHEQTLPSSSRMHSDDRILHTHYLIVFLPLRGMLGFPHMMFLFSQFVHPVTMYSPLGSAHQPPVQGATYLYTNRSSGLRHNRCQNLRAMYSFPASGSPSSRYQHSWSRYSVRKASKMT